MFSRLVPAWPEFSFFTTPTGMCDDFPESWPDRFRLVYEAKTSNIFFHELDFIHRLLAAGP